MELTTSPSTSYRLQHTSRLFHCFSLHDQPLISRQQKSFPEDQRPHFYVDLNKEGEAGLKASQKFRAMKPTLLTQGVKASDVVLALDGEMIALIAMYETIEAADPVSFLLRLIVFSTDERHRNTKKTVHTSQSTA